MTAVANGRAFLTGATGFIGGRLAAALTARGYRLRCLVRSPDRAAGLASLGAELVVGDVTDEAALDRGLEGADVAYHVAAVYVVGLVDRAEMERTNVEGTRAFLSALQRASVAQAVYVSTTSVLAESDGEDVSMSAGPWATEYQRTKAAAHRLAVRAQQDGAPLVIVCPATVYGPGDPGPIGKHIRDVLRHRLPGLSTRPSWLSYVHVDDVVQGLVAAGERGVRGAVYVLSGEPLDTTSFAQRVARLAGTWVSPLRFPPFAVKLTGSAMDAASRLLNVELPVSRELAAFAGTGARHVHSHARATRELGYAPRGLAEGLPETVRDIQAHLAR